MKHKVNDNKLKNLLEDYVVSWPVLLLISIILFGSDFILSRPVYITLLDTGELVGNFLALGMATLFTVLPKVIAKLFAKESYPLGSFAILLGIGLLAFIFIGQKEVAEQIDPIETFLASDTGVEIESNTHFVATALVTLLFTIGTFLSYLFYSDRAKDKPMIFKLAMSKLARLFQFNLLILRGFFKRAESKPRIGAESKVNDKLEEMEKEVRELQLSLDRKQADLKHDLDKHNNRKERIKAAIEAAYKI